MSIAQRNKVIWVEKGLLRVLTPIKRLEYFEKHYPKVYQCAPQKHIASLLGIAAETLSRLRRKPLDDAKTC